MADADAPPTDDLVTTSHTLLTPAGDLAHTATAGRIVLCTETHTEGTFGGLDRVAARLADQTGLSEEYVRRVRLPVEQRRFFRELLRGSGRTVGRFDARFTGWEPDDGGEYPSYDLSLAAITGPYTAAFNSHVRTVLGCASDYSYEVFTKPLQWPYPEFEGRGVSVVGKLSAARRMNPPLRVHVACG